MWILIIVLMIDRSGKSITTAEFTSQAKCQAAAQALQSDTQAKDMQAIQSSTGGDYPGEMYTLCVEK